MKTILRSVILGIFFLSLAVPWARADYEYPGKWKVTGKDKSIYYILIDLGGNAQSTLGKGQMGEWTLAGDGIQITWTDGTAETLGKRGSGYVKTSSYNSIGSPAEKV